MQVVREVSVLDAATVTSASTPLPENTSVKITTDIYQLQSASSAICGRYQINFPLHLFIQHSKLSR